MPATLQDFPDLPTTNPPHWISRSAFPILTLALIATQVLLGFAIYHNSLWLTLILVAVVSHLNHGQLIGFHEASHGLLRKRRGLNDFDGFLIGVFSFMSFTLYRAAHQTHHMHLASERDEELWPFVDTAAPRWKRVIAAICELTCGIAFTPFVFFRTFFRKNSVIRSQKVRRQIWKEIVFIVLIWIAILTAVTYFDVWRYFLWMYVIPAIISGNLQSWRKYIEHVGMQGNTPNSATRSIVCNSWAGRLFAFTLLHEPFHGVHHERSGLTHAELPQYVSDLDPKTPDEVAPFPNYRTALLDLLRCLTNPRVGGQWKSIS